MDFDFILHHHDPSPFAEKIRKVFGVKAVSWVSVQVPMTMPKPDLTTLTGGYRGAPVMQIGANIYCDTRRILAEIEYRKPSLLQSGPLLNYAMQHWSDDAFWEPGSALSLHENAAHIPAAVSKDREAYFRNLDFARFADDAPFHRSQIRAHAALVNAQLGDGRAFITGETVEWIDVGAWQNFFMAKGNIPSSNELYADLGFLREWALRMEGFGHGERRDISGAEAIAIAKDAAPVLPDTTEACPANPGFEPGSVICVYPAAHPETAVRGVLRAFTDVEIVIEREDPTAGRLAVHFPVIGYRVDAAA